MRAIYLAPKFRRWVALSEWVKSAWKVCSVPRGLALGEQVVELESPVT